MISKITCLDDYICFFKKESFELKPITLLVGDQGCGKSTLLQIIRDCVKKESDHRCFDVEHSGNAQAGIVFLDMEKNNPAIEGANPNDSQDMIYKLLSRWESHGETLFPILRELESFKDSFILLDEPETALSLRSQYALIEIFKKCLENNCQIIIATHNIVFMEAFPDSVLSLEHMKYLTPRKFVNLQKKPNTSKMKRVDKRIKKTNCRMGLECECTKTSPVYDKNCIHYVDRDGTSGYKRRGNWLNSRMKPGDFKNG
jgi:predicted ATPase